MQDRDMVLIFLFILMRRDMTIDDAIMDCFQVFEKFHEFLFETHMMCVVYIASVLCAVWQRDFLYWTALYYQRFQPGVTSFPRGHLAIPGVIFGCHDLCDELLLASSVYRLRMLLKILPCKTAPFDKRLIQPPVFIVLRLRSLC